MAVLEGRRTGWFVAIVASVLLVCVLSFQQQTDAQSRAEPFVNSGQQRLEMINLLKEISTQLKEQNALLRSGQVTVIVAPPPQR